MRTEVRLASPPRQSATPSTLGVLALAAALSGCDAIENPGAGAVVQPTATPSIQASIEQPAPARPAHVGVAGCGFSPWFRPTFDVVIVALAPVHIHRVTMQMVDGSVLGGPMIPFPSTVAPPNPMFMPTGVTKVFTFQSPFACAATLSRTVRANIAFVSRAGVTQVVTVDALFR